MKVLKTLIVLLIISMIAFSCSKNSGNNATDNQKEPPQEVSVDPITVPTNLQNSTDPYARQVVTYVQWVNMFQGFVDNLIPANQLGKTFTGQDVMGGPPWVYTWTNGTITATLTITIEDDQYHWKLVFNGVDQSSHQTFKDYVYIEAWQKLDGSSGKLVVNDYNENQDQLIWTWNIDKEGTETVVFTDSGSNAKIEVVQKKDLSGTLEMWENDVLKFKSVWNADGSGTWWAYDDAGNETSSGTWG